MQFSLNGIVTGLVLLVAGTCFIRYSYPISRFTGSQDWIENIVGPGTTNGAYKLLGLLATFIGVLLITGLANPFFYWVFTPVRGIFGH